MSVSSAFLSLYDKTANPGFAGHTVTQGTFDVTGIHHSNMEREELLRLTAHAESN